MTKFQSNMRKIKKYFDRFMERVIKMNECFHIIIPNLFLTNFIVLSLEVTWERKIVHFHQAPKQTFTIFN